MKRLVVVGTLSAVFLVAGCASSTSVTGSAASVTVVPTTVTERAPTTSAVSPATTPPAAAPENSSAQSPVASTTAATAPPVATGITQISVTVGKDDSPTRVEKVAMGATVQLALLNPSVDDEFHLHGYDIDQKVKAGAQGIVSFVADQRGSFALESHLNDKVLVTLVVS